MKQTPVQRLARILKVLVIITFVCNIITLFLVPGLVGIWTEGGVAAFLAIDPAVGHSPLRLAVLFLAACSQFLWRVWRFSKDCGVLVLYLLFFGACTAVILWQARRVLNTILKGEPFSMTNAVCLRRAAVCCFLIAGAALLRVAWGLFYFWGFYVSVLEIDALRSAPFVPIFLMAGLLCMVISALFCQAAELKAENDLTI